MTPRCVSTLSGQGGVNVLFLAEKDTRTALSRLEVACRFFQFLSETWKH